MTKVKFYKDVDNDILAVFPEEIYCKELYNDDLVMSYQHVGQHGACSVEYANDLVEASTKEFNSLLLELESLDYDDLIILN